MRTAPRRQAAAMPGGPSGTRGARPGQARPHMWQYSELRGWKSSQAGITGPLTPYFTLRETSTSPGDYAGTATPTSTVACSSMWLEREREMRQALGFLQQTLGPLLVGALGD